MVAVEALATAVCPRPGPEQAAALVVGAVAAVAAMPNSRQAPGRKVDPWT